MSVSLISKLHTIVGKRALNRLGWLNAAIIVMGLFEVVGVTSIFPFMQLVSDPTIATSDERFSYFFTFFGVSDHRSMVIVGGIAVILLLTLSNTLSGLVGYWQQRVTWQFSHQLSMRLLTAYLERPYAFYLRHNTKDIQTKLLQEISNLTTEVVSQGLQVISKVFVTLLLFTLLCLVDPWLAVSTLLLFGSVFAVIFLGRRTLLVKLGQLRREMYFKRFRTLGELFAGIKTYFVYKVDDYFLGRFEHASSELTKIPPRMFLVTKLPRLVVEIFAFGGIIAMTLYLYLRNGNIQEILPTLSLYALASIRLLPALQVIYNGVATIRHNVPVVDSIYEDLTYRSDRGRSIRATSATFPLRQEIKVAVERFHYEDESEPALRNVALTIPRGATVAFAGTTGSGKTTLVDVIIGLLWTDRGGVTIDGEALTPANAGAWQQGVSYVPQDVTLFDDTVLRNICLGEEEDQIDWPRLEAAVQAAQIDSFIASLEQGYQTEVGERGTRVSGGEKQRIGLARALYRRPEVLILDEATSALDTVTERGVLRSLRDYNTEVTVIMIAHRLSTIRNADTIYLLSAGEIVARGSFEELLSTNLAFQQMVHTD